MLEIAASALRIARSIKALDWRLHCVLMVLIITLNLLLLAVVPVFGAHYLVDIIAGVVLATQSIRSGVV